MEKQQIETFLRLVDMNGELTDREILSVLLHGVSPVYSGEQIADELIKSYGTLVEITEVPYRFLLNVKGLGEDGVRIIKMLRAAIFNITRKNSSDSIRRLFNTDEMSDYLRPYFIGAKTEMTYMAFTNARYRLIHTQKLGEGDFNSTPLSFRKMMRLITAYDAYGVVLAHNHNSTLYPSSNDIVLTNKLNSVLNEIGVELIDHLIFFENRHLSLKEAGYIQNIKKTDSLSVF